MLPTNIDKYSPEELRKQASELGKSALSQGADRLVENSPSAAQQVEHFERVRTEYLRGVPPLSASELSKLNLHDSDELSKQVLSNVADRMGIPTTAKNIEGYAKQSFEELKAQGKEMFAQAVTEAIAQLGAESVVKSVPVQYGLGLVTVSAEALEDGKLSQGDMMTIGATAMTNASTMFAATSATIGLGLLGGVGAFVAAGVVYLEGLAEAERARKRALLEFGRQQVAEEERAIDLFLEGFEEHYARSGQLVWQAKDDAVGTIANSWAALQDQIGTEFELRFFPGALPPLRGGWYRRRQNSSYLQKVACQQLSGCLYFPGAASHIPVQKTVKYLQDMQNENRVLSRTSVWDSEYYAFSPYHAPGIASVYGGPAYAYYWRTLRAFDALVPHEGGGVGFWVHPRHSKRFERKQFKDYLWLGSDWLCWVTTTRSIPNCVPGCGYLGCDIPPSQFRRNIVREQLAQQYAYWKDVGFYRRDPKLRRDLDMQREAMEYVDNMFEELRDEGIAVDTYRTRLLGDLIQTANAVQGEQFAAVRLGQVAKGLGLSMVNTAVVGQLDVQAKKDIYVLDDQTRQVLSEVNSKNTKLNLGALFVGAGFAAAGAGMWAAKRRRR